MKKNVLFYIAISVIVVLAIISIILLRYKNEITDSNEVLKIVSETNLESIIDLGNFEKNSYSEKDLLAVAMKFAEKNGYMNESSDGVYVEYVNKSDLHEIISELTGIVIDAPIQIEDFYYIYDSENEYYYNAGMEIPEYEISKIEHVYKDDDSYTIECSAIKMEDGEVIADDKIVTELKKNVDSSYANYQVIKQEIL